MGFTAEQCLRAKVIYVGRLNYPEAFFGMNESQIKDYFRAQEGRSEFIAKNYAAPVVTFLSNTDGSYAATDLVSRV